MSNTDCAVGSPPDAQRKRGAMVGGMSAAFGRPRDTSDATRAAPLRGVSANHAAASQVGVSCPVTSIFPPWIRSC
jgi:hypothetical protein